MDAIDPALNELRLRDYRPRPMLRTTAHDIARAAHPAVDAHNHLGRWLTPGWSTPDVDDLLNLMDAVNVETLVNLDGRWPDELGPNLDRYDRSHPGRFVTFCQLDWSVTGADGFGERLAEQLREALEQGARGLKVWKDLGLHIRDPQGRVLPPDDARLDAVWDAAAEAGVPVLIHTGDPAAFFEPLDATNERLEELIVNPDWWFGDRDRFPAFAFLLAAFERLVSAHPRTTFIGAHVAGNAEDLAWVDRLLTSYPNLHVDIAARVAELGRQPRAARSLIMAHPDRVLFGTDESPSHRQDYGRHFRFFETADEAFDYASDPIPPQGRWTITGLDLPQEVLRSVYGDNARRLLGSP